MLASLLLHYLQTQTPIDPSYRARAREILDYLNDQRQTQRKFSEGVVGIQLPDLA
jgi:hypothetical protein